MHVLHIFIEAAEQGVNHGRFARTSLSCEEHEALSLRNPVDQKGQGFPVDLAQIQEARWTGEIEGSFVQSVMGSIHLSTTAAAGTRPALLDLLTTYYIIYNSFLPV